MFNKKEIIELKKMFVTLATMNLSQKLEISTLKIKVSILEEQIQKLLEPKKKK